ncbi:MAG: hypothetical protein HYZ22_17895 [Chloroflexi bacterium]|nr:hypothetical protein [Chloroflexota bacterium]
MSDTTRWVLVILFIGLGIIAAIFSLGILGFFTWGCYGPSNATAYNILYVASFITLVAGIVPAVMLIRKAAGKYVWIAIALGVIATIASNGVFVFYTTNICQ